MNLTCSLNMFAGLKRTLFRATETNKCVRASTDRDQVNQQTVTVATGDDFAPVGSREISYGDAFPHQL